MQEISKQVCLFLEIELIIFVAVAVFVVRVRGSHEGLVAVEYVLFSFGYNWCGVYHALSGIVLQCRFDCCTISSDEVMLTFSIDIMEES